MDRAEWLQMIEMAESSSSEEMRSLLECMERLQHRQKQRGHQFASDQAVNKKPFMILRHDHAIRMIWDVLMMMLLIYIALSLPYSLGFGQPEALEILNSVLDFVFCFD